MVNKMRLMAYIFLILSITSCSKNFKEKLGIETSGPNEYLIERNQPLEIPPHYDLPVPS